jgi:hypothetical protein
MFREMAGMDETLSALLQKRNCVYIIKHESNIISVIENLLIALCEDMDPSKEELLKGRDCLVIISEIMGKPIIAYSEESIRLWRQLFRDSQSQWDHCFSDLLKLLAHKSIYQRNGWFQEYLYQKIAALSHDTSMERGSQICDLLHHILLQDCTNFKPFVKCLVSKYITLNAGRIHVESDTTTVILYHSQDEKQIMTKMRHLLVHFLLQKDVSLLYVVLDQFSETKWDTVPEQRRLEASGALFLELLHYFVKLNEQPRKLLKVEQKYRQFLTVLLKKIIEIALQVPKNMSSHFPTYFLDSFIDMVFSKLRNMFGFMAVVDALHIQGYLKHHMITFSSQVALPSIHSSKKSDSVSDWLGKRIENMIDHFNRFFDDESGPAMKRSASALPFEEMLVLKQENLSPIDETMKHGNCSSHRW